MAALQTLLLFEGGIGEGAPQNQSGGVNVTFQPDGTCAVSSGTPMTPVNWMSVAPQTGVGAFYTYTATDTGGSGATGISNNGIALSLATPQITTASGGPGSRTFSYVIKNLAGTTVASGTGTANNTI